jgi:hypothetical protein
MRAFWSNSQHFPYCLSGIITGQDSTNRRESIKYQIKGYGPGFLFEPFLILSDKKGNQLQKQLDTLSDQRGKELNKLNQKYLRKLDLIMKEYKK